MLKNIIIKIKKFLHSRIKGQIDIFSVASTSFPIKTFSINFNLPSINITKTETVVIHKLQSVILHIPSQMLFRSTNDGRVDYIIWESNYDNIEHRLQFSPLFWGIRNYKKYLKRTRHVVFPRPLFVFSVTRKKINYYHVMVEDISRVLLLINNYGPEFDIMYDASVANFAKRALEIIAKNYGMKLFEFPDEEFLFFDSPILIIEDTCKRKFNYTEFGEQFAKDQVANYISAWSQKPEWSSAVFDRGLIPKGWIFPASKKRRFFKTNLVTTLPSNQALNSFDILKKAALAEDTKAENSITLITRNIKARPGRRIINEDQLVKAIKNLQLIDSAVLSLEETVATAHNSDVLIGVHGAGLTNAIFMRPGTMLIELFPTSIAFPPPDHFYHICVARKVHHIVLCVEVSIDQKGIELSEEMIREISKIAQKGAG